MVTAIYFLIGTSTLNNRYRQERVTLDTLNLGLDVHIASGIEVNVHLTSSMTLDVPLTPTIVDQISVLIHLPEEKQQKTINFSRAN